MSRSEALTATTASQFAPMMTMLAIGMLANVCIDITEVRKNMHASQCLQQQQQQR
jgi:hypothetical protein